MLPVVKGWICLPRLALSEWLTLYGLRLKHHYAYSTYETFINDSYGNSEANASELVVNIDEGYHRYK